METHQIGANRAPRPELKALTGLRGVAASTVAVAHVQQLLLWQCAAVDLFFCLSGFTLSYVYGGRHFQFSSYVAARIARVYPLYFLTLFIAGAVYILPLVINPETYPAKRAASDFLMQLLMLNCWPILGSGVHWNTPAWSISVEWFCYVLLFPLLLVLKAPRLASVRLLGLVVLSAASYYLFVTFYDERLTNPELYIAKNAWSYWVNLLRGVFGFVAGWVTFASFEKQDGLCAFCIRFSTTIWLSFIAILVLQYVGIVSSQALVFLFPFVVLAATDANSTSSRLLGSRLLHFLGVISYSIYMTHMIVFAAFIAVSGTTPQTWTISIHAALIVATFVVSVCSYFAIEVPARNAIRGLLGIRPAPIAP